MDGKAKYLFPVVMIVIIVFPVRIVVTFLPVAARVDDGSQRLGSVIITWLIAAVAAFFAIPAARPGTRNVVALIEGAR